MQAANVLQFVDVAVICFYKLEPIDPLLPQFPVP